MVAAKDGPACIAPLFVPGDRPELLAKAAGSGADAVIVDLEDSVAPEKKDLARGLLSAVPGLPTYVRVNACGTPWHCNDIRAVRDLPFAGIMLPKAELDEHAKDLASLINHLPVWALLETPRGLAQARAIAAHPRVHRLAFGALDYSAAIGCAHTESALLSARSEIVLASALAGLAGPLDGVAVALRDAAAVEAEAQYASSLGFGGKMCIHPAQVGAVMRGFSPRDSEIAWAKKVLESHGSVSAIDGAMVDAPVRRRAQSILARCRQA